MPGPELRSAAAASLVDETMFFMLGKRHRPPKKNSRVRKPKTTAASLDESSSPPASITTAPIVEDHNPDVPASQELSHDPDVPASQKLSHEELFPKDIRSVDGRVERIEYFCCHTSPFQEDDTPIGPPSFETVQTEGSGSFWQFLASRIRR